MVISPRKKSKKAPKLTITTVCCGTEIKFETKERKAEWSKKGVCPNCQEIYSDKPPTERELAFKQDEYYAQSRHPARLVEMSEMWKPYIRSLGYKVFGTAIGDKENEEEFIAEVSSIIISRYCKNNALYIESFAGYIKKVFLQIKVVGYGPDHLEEEWEASPEGTIVSDKTEVVNSTIDHVAENCGSTFSNRIINLFALNLHLESPDTNKKRIQSLYTTFNMPVSELDNVLATFKDHLISRCQFSTTSRN